MELRTATKSCRKNFWMIPSRNIQKVDKTHEYSRLNFIRKTTNPKDRESDSFKKHNYRFPSLYKTQEHPQPT